MNNPPYNLISELTVNLGDRSYPIFIGTDLIKQPHFFIDYLPSKQIMIVTNEVVAPLYLETLKSTLDGFDVSTIILPDGEKHKTMKTINSILNELVNTGFDRSCTVLALGGGVIGDLTGFAASCYQRGVNFIQVPTTLLSQVDSSVGGKTGVNHSSGKNMIGAFHQPNAVIIDINTLNSLPAREISAGIAEIIKYGLINDANFFAWLEKNMENLKQLKPQAVSYAIQKSCSLKARIVAKDERETGSRALLNLGHTFGHAIETGTGYGAWLHGEAVGAGICMAARLSARMGKIYTKTCERIETLISQAGLPIKSPATIKPQHFLNLMNKDKKVKQGKLHMILLEEIGKACITSDLDQKIIREIVLSNTLND